MSRRKLDMLGGSIVGVSVLAVLVWATQPPRAQAPKRPATGQSYDEQIQNNAARMLEEGKQIFRFDTFGSEDFWGGKLRLHEAIAGAKNGGDARSDRA